jgi:23S rRNA pseudouridine2605 synthase
LNHTFQTRHAAVLCKGINEGGEFLQAEKVVLSKKGGAETNRLEIHLHHGKKREIRRLLEAFGYRVIRLRRFQIGGLILRGIGPGRYRRLKNEELRLLFA